MARSPRSREQRIYSLAASRDEAASLKALLETEAVKKWFDDTQKQHVARVTAAAGMDDETLRIAGLQLQTFLQFKNALNVAAGQADAADKQIKRLTNE